MEEESNYWQKTMHQRLSRRTVLRTGALASLGLVAGGSALGCGSRPRADITIGEQPQSGGVLTCSIGGDPPNFDLISNSTYMMEHPMAPVYNNLVQYDPMDPNKVIGDLASKWEVSSDGKVYTFYLIKGVNFHDGKPCTSADVKYTFDIVRDPPKGVVSPRKGALAAVDGIETPDDYTVRFVLRRPSPSLLTNLAQGWMAVLPKHILQEKGDMKKDAIGTGPFKFKEYTRGVSLELVRNPDYHVKGRPYLDGVKFFVIPDPSTAFANFRTGQVLYWYGITGEDGRRAEQEFGDRIVVQTCPGFGFSAIAFNSHRKPWDDVRMRQAVSLAIDRAEAIKVVRQGDGGIGGFMPAGGVWSLPMAELEKIPGYGKDMAANIAMAKKLMAEVGYPNGLATTLLTRKTATSEALSVFLKDQMVKVGIDARLDVQETAAAYDSFNNRTFDLGPWEHAIAVDDPDGIFGEFYTCNADRNYSDICSKEVDDLFNKQSQTLNVEERKKLVAQMEKAALMTVTRVLLYWTKRFLGLSRRVQNYKIHPSNYNNQRLQDVWLAKA